MFHVDKVIDDGCYHPEQPGSLAARLLAGDPDITPRHFGDVISTGKLLSPNVYFQIEMENKHNRREYATNGPQLHRGKQYCFTVSICHLVKVDPKTLESNCYWKNYLTDSRFVPPIDLLAFPPIGHSSGP
jgi:hypothetical protein